MASAQPVAVRHAARRQEADPDGQAGRLGALLREGARTTSSRPTASSRVSSRCRAQVLDDIHLKAKPAGTVWLPVPRGTAAVSCNSFCPDAQAPGTVWYLFRPPTEDSEIVTGNEISSAKADIDQAGQPDRLALVQERRRPGLHRHHPPDRAGGKTPPLGDPPAGPLQRDRRRQQAGRRADGDSARRTRTASTPPLSGGSEITGVSRREARRIALEITSGTLPVKFTPLSQQLVSATLGENSLRDGLIAGAAGLVFVMIFLVAFYGFLGVIADIALVVYGLLLAGIVAAPPGHHDAPRDRRHDPHDRRRGRREHRHLRAHQGGGARREDRSGPRSRRATGAASTRSSTPTSSR